MEKARTLIVKYGFKPVEANCAIEAKPPVSWNKGRAAIYILRTAFGVDWSERIKIIYAGDDMTDEEAMTVSINTSHRSIKIRINSNKNSLYQQALKGMAATFRISSEHIIKTVADHRLSSTDSVLTMLKWVERHFMRRKPRANSLTYRNAKKDAFKLHMSFDANSVSPTAVAANANNRISETGNDDGA